MSDNSILLFKVGEIKYYEELCAEIKKILNTTKTYV